MTFSELKYHMKMLFVSGEDSKGKNVNSANLLNSLKMEESDDE